MTTKSRINRALHPKSSEKFYVSFYKLPENISNILGRDVQAASRPIYSFNEYSIYNKGVKVTGSSVIEYQPIDLTFLDDTNSLVNYALYEQIKRQTKVSPQAFNDSLFEMTIKVFSADSVLTEIITIRYCRIQTINHSEQIYADSTNNITTVSIAFNEVDYAFPNL